MATEKAVITQSHLTNIANAIIAKGGADAPLLPSQMAAAIEAIPTGGGGETVSKSDVNFYTPYGDLIKSFTKDAFLTELNKASVNGLKDIVPMPALEGLTAQDWNWSKSTWATTKEKLIDQLDKQGIVDIGGMYVTDNGETRLYLHIAEDARLTQPLRFGRSGGTSIVVDWGDGSSNTYTHTSQTQVSHTYPSKGDYVIRMSSVGAAKILFVGSSVLNIFGSTTNNATNPARLYSSRLTKVELGNNITSIGTYAFYYCYSLSSVVIPQGVTSIGTYAFRFCYSLSSVVIPQGVTSIGTYAFYYCYSLSSVVIPQGVTSIGDYAFYYCYSLSSVVIPQGVTSIGNNAFTSCYSLSSVVIPQGVTSIGSGAFNTCYSLSSVVIPQGVTSIGNNAFTSCSSLSSVVIPQGVTSIGTSVFASCSSLSSVVILQGMTSIGSGAFVSCNGIVVYDFTAATAVPTLSNVNAFTGIATDAKIVVPDELYESWCAATNWSDASIVSHIIKASEYFGG